MTEERTKRRAADRLVEVLEAEGVRRIYGVPGAKIDGVYDALLDGGPDVVVCRHEQNAAFIAAAEGRITGHPGTVLVTSGPGTANLATGLLTATTEQDPVVALCGAVQRSDRLKRTHQSMDAADLLRAVTKSTVEVADPRNVAEAVSNAFRTATTEPRGACAVILPADVMAELTEASIPRSFAEPTLGAASPDLVRRAVRAILAADRPVLMVGLRAADDRTVRAVRALLEQTGLPVVETFQAAGVVPRELDHLYMGRVGLFRNQPADVLVAHADLLVTIGYDPVEYDPVTWNTDVHREVLHIDTVPATIDNNYQPTYELRGDIAETLDAIRNALVGHDLMRNPGSARTRDRLDAIDFEARSVEARPGTLNPAAAVLRMREVLHPSATVTCDIGSVYIHMARHFRVHEPRRLLFSNGQQTLGVGFPWGMAAALVRPETQVVSVSGDGGFLFSAQELETATRLGLSLVHVIFRDDTYDMVGFQQLLKYGRKSAVQLGDYDVVAYAAAFGARGRRVTSEDDFVTALRDAVAEPGVSIIDVAVDYSHNTDLGAVQLEEAFE
jgi:acetolactate synthase I/II/III large subunit